MNAWSKPDTEYNSGSNQTNDTGHILQHNYLQRGEIIITLAGIRFRLYFFVNNQIAW